ncbi:hypothetical protein RHBI111906_09530 [Rhodothermus bifroesti]|nr:hypothetical protein HRbin18_01810 [bacterium HR18]
MLSVQDQLPCASQPLQGFLVGDGSLPGSGRPRCRILRSNSCQRCSSIAGLGEVATAVASQSCCKACHTASCRGSANRHCCTRCCSLSGASPAKQSTRFCQLSGLSTTAYRLALHLKRHNSCYPALLDLKAGQLYAQKFYGFGQLVADGFRRNSHDFCDLGIRKPMLPM